MVSRRKEGGVQHVPCTLFPTPFPEKEFKKALAVQPHLNTMMSRVRQDRAFLVSELTEAAVTDVFTKRLLAVYANAAATSGNQLSMSIHRSDYMLDQGADASTVPKIKQVEVNTISCAFAGLAAKPQELHQFVLERNVAGGAALASKIPANNVLPNLCKAMAACIAAYRRKYAVPTGTDVVICMVVQPGEANAFDQRQLEFELWSVHKVRVIRRSLNQLRSEAVTDQGSDGRLTVGGYEVGLAYYRAGYSPDDYPSDVEWEARLLLEQARCAKCPSIADHLSGAKKIQQAIAMPGLVEKYMPEDPAVAALIRDTFTGLYSLADSEGGPAAAARACADPDAFVMKPQREGGGTLLVGDAMCHALKTMSSEERASYILMDRIVPPACANYIMRDGEERLFSVLSELGIFGATIMDGTTLLQNVCCGHLLRTKPHGVEDGGVAAGRAVLDAPFLWGGADDSGGASGGDGGGGSRPGTAKPAWWG